MHSETLDDLRYQRDDAREQLRGKIDRIEFLSVQLANNDDEIARLTARIVALEGALNELIDECAFFSDAHRWLPSAEETIAELDPQAWAEFDIAWDKANAILETRAASATPAPTADEGDPAHLDKLR